MKFLNTLIILCILGLSISCKKNDSVKANEANLLKVTCTFGIGIIDTAADKVIIKAPESTDISKMITEFEISKNATIYPPSGVALDFSNPITFTIISEDKTKNYVFTVSVIKPIIKFTVYDCSNWSPQSFRALQANAVIKIYTNTVYGEPLKTYDVLTSDQNAQAILYGVKTNNYHYTVEKDNKSNIVNGYVLLGTYNNQADIDFSADRNAKIGDLKYWDCNGDGIISSYDKNNYDVIWGAYDLINHDFLLKDLYITNKN